LILDPLERTLRIKLVLTIARTVTYLSTPALRPVIAQGLSPVQLIL
jgi:hypothetical protein